ncbi:MAG: hypothetical protein IJV00_09550, partial [Clostridia bacterium]|nr:hypothetical protein [Clostridia bacterium]
FEILFDNMNEIAPSGEGKDEDRRVWLENVSPALDKAPRQLIVISDSGVPVGFFMYYVNQTTFMMEEIQFKKPYQGIGLFRQLYTLLGQIIKCDVPFVEAYAHKTNLRSRAILSHLGLEELEELPDKKISHFRGDCDKMLDRYR